MFEDFHQAIYSHLFYQWICLNQSTYQKDHVLFERSHQDEDCQILLFQMEKVIGKIMIWKQNIVEEEIQNNQGKQLFYLHYDIMNINQCCQMFQDFYQTLINHNQTSLYHIAICGSGGLSTSLFSKEIQTICQQDNHPFDIDYLSFEDLKKCHQKYDALFLAPQIAYLQPELIRQCHIPTFVIDATDYATKNYGHILETMKKTIK